jgi:2-polyprenyl-6-methoxyphenol hydroxylase-like FAD-dependent oxidoreductase
MAPYHKRQMEQDRKRKDSSLMSICANVIVNNTKLFKVLLDNVTHETHTEIISALRVALFENRLYRTNAAKLHLSIDAIENKTVNYKYKIGCDSVAGTSPPSIIEFDETDEKVNECRKQYFRFN